MVSLLVVRDTTLRAASRVMLVAAAAATAAAAAISVSSLNGPVSG